MTWQNAVAWAGVATAAAAGVLALALARVSADADRIAEHHDPPPDLDDPDVIGPPAHPRVRLIPRPDPAVTDLETFRRRHHPAQPTQQDQPTSEGPTAS